MSRNFLFGALAITSASLPAVAEVAPTTSSLFPSTMPPQPYDTSSVLLRPNAPLSGLAENLSPFQWGPVSLRPHLNYSFSYGDGIQSSPDNPEKTIRQELSPGVTFLLGTHWTLDYTPSLSFYSSDKFDDTLAHNVRLNGATTYGNWALGLSQTYSVSSDPLVETGRQTDQENFSTGLNGSYHFSDALWTDLAVNQNFRFADEFTDSREWSTTDWLNYQFFPGCFAGVGVGGGYVDMVTGSDNAYESLNGQVGWRPTEKISLHFNVGGETRQFLDSNSDTLINPIFGASISYSPLDVTTISLSANRGVSTSYFDNQVTENTGVQISLSQRLLEKLNLNVGFGYSTTKYVSGVQGQSLNREDSGTFFNVGLNCPIRTRMTAGVFYTYNENSSDNNGFGYNSTQVGFNLGYHF